MFGNNNNNGITNNINTATNRPPASGQAAIEGNLTHLLIGDTQSVAGWHLFLNAQEVPTGEFESLSIEINAPDDASEGTLTGLLSRYVTDTNGQRTQRSVSLFPGTVEVIANGRRITVTCQEPGSFDGLWLGIGLRSDGTSLELGGVQSLRILASPESKLLDARLTWVDNGAVEEILS
jgi:hypothetical protein